MIEKILNKLGYFKEVSSSNLRDLEMNPLTEEELSYMLVNLLGDMDTYMDPEAEQKIFADLKRVDGFVEYLKIAAMNDMKRHFGAATPKEQDIIRGSFARTNYLKIRIMNEGEKK